MSTYRSSTKNCRAHHRLIAAAIAVLLLVSACGSADDGASGSGSEETPPATLLPTTAPLSEPTETPEAETPEPTEIPEATPEPTPTPPPTAEPTPDEPEAIPIETPDLVGPNWYVRSVDSAGGEVAARPTGAVARIQFNPDGSITGNSGCNDIIATYTVDGAELSITNLSTTDMNCLIPDWSAFVEFLPEVTGYGSAGGPDPILFVGNDRSISLGSTPPDPAASPIADYIGLTELEAAQLADTRGVAFRVSSIDGEPQALTMDFVEDRVNVELVNGVVVAGNLG